MHLNNDKSIPENTRKCYWHPDYVMPLPVVLASKFIDFDKIDKSFSRESRSTDQKER